MREFIETYIPASLSQPIIAFGKRLKQALRAARRSVKYQQLPFFKEIHVHGLSFWLMLKPRQNGTIDEAITNTGTWETELGAALKKHIRRGDVFVDIGANIGYHTMFVAAHLANTGKVFAFEPIRALYDQASESLKKNGFANVTLINAALGTTPGHATLSVRHENMGESSIGAYKDLPLAPVSEMEVIAIDTLDQAVGSHSRIHVIKIDTEGYEFEALKGGKVTLEDCHPIIFLEFSPMFYESDYRGKSEDFVRYLSGLGYVFSTLDEQPLDLMAWTKQHAENNLAQIDIICSLPKAA